MTQSFYSSSLFYKKRWIIPCINKFKRRITFIILSLSIKDELDFRKEDNRDLLIYKD